MKKYPSIPTEPVYNIPFHIWEKIDGSNIRIEWSKKRGFYKFGSRKRLLASDNFILSKTHSLLTKETKESIEKFFGEKKAQRAICYFEFYGPESFAGSHDPNDNEQKLYLIDIEILGNGKNTGFITQEEYINIFHNSDKVLTPQYRGFQKITITDIEEIKYKLQPMKGPLFEGVVCKSDETEKYSRNRILFKIKNNMWIGKARSLGKVGEDEV